MLPADHLAVADDEELEAGLPLLAGDPDDILLGAAECRDLLLLDRALDGAQLVPRDRSLLVAECRRMVFHLIAQLVGDPFLASVEEVDHAVDGGPVLGLLDRLDARALAALDVVEQARPLQDALALGDLQVAGAEGEDPAQQLQRLVDAGGGRVRADVATAVPGQLARAHDPGEILVERDLDERVALVVAQPDVEAGPMLLDQVRLEQEGLAHRVSHDVLDVRHLGGHAHDPRVEADLRPEVGADPMPEQIGLADVQNSPIGALHQVHPGGEGKLAQDRADMRVARCGYRHGRLGLGTGVGNGRANSDWMYAFRGS